jgi:hypothetical protein
VRSFFADPYRNSESVDRFYRVLERAAHAKARDEAGRPADERDIEFSDYFPKVSKELSDLGGERAAIQQDPGLSPGKKRELMDEIDREMADMAREALEEYDAYGSAKR